jgi:preprotein translocase subunit YajC
MQFSLILLQAGASGPSSLIGTALPLVIMFVIAYVLILLPVQKQKKKQQQMLASLESGQTVVTSGGIVGTIIAVNSDDTLILRIKPDGLKIQVTRGSVASAVNPATETKK